jgi:YfiH family protein
MISAPTRQGGAVFSEASDGDLRSDSSAREALAGRLDISDAWATVDQVHGRVVAKATAPGGHGEADAIWTAVPGLPVAIFTADCLGVVIRSNEAVGVAHAGWRGAAAGVVGALIDEMSRAGHVPTEAALGPGIRPCCFEVGPEVIALIGHETETTWGTASVDLHEAVSMQIPSGVSVWAVDGCTMHEDRWFSHRADATRSRMATVGWI